MNESEIIQVGKSIITDLIKKVFVELHIFFHKDNRLEKRITEIELDHILNNREYWFSELASEEKTLGLYLNPLGFDVAVGKLDFDKTPL